MAVRFPVLPARLELGVGLDLSWGQEPGLVKDPVRGDVVSDVVVSLLEEQASICSHLAVFWQPRRRAHVEARDYFPAYDDLFARVGSLFATRALYHSAPSRSAVEAYRRGELLELTNALVERYGFGWVSEDLGLWPIQGKPPQTMGPRFNQEGLWAAIRHARVMRAGLEVPLLVDFPSFATTAAAHEAPIHAYAFLRQVADEADIGVALDTAKLISYQWERGRRGADLFGELDELPLARCFEIHVSGRDAKSGRGFQGPGDELFDAQVALLERLVPLCPNVRVVGYRGPLFDVGGDAVKLTLSGLARLRQVLTSWIVTSPSDPPAAIQA